LARRLAVFLAVSLLFCQSGEQILDEFAPLLFFMYAEKIDFTGWARVPIKTAFEAVFEERSQ
jgi:hypothetical protein